ncbi:hypothetical protein B0H10DRAFT_2445162 [Mycena sp. CBHHK59/15]|nr:hypothetical protein B0H10DRAFT_2445162 [Mycena sp. CBHHK59/15]
MVIRDVRHRWNYTHVMIERRLLLREAIDTSVIEKPELRPLSLNDDHWELLEALGSLLKGFHPSGFATGRRAVTTGRDPSVQYFSVRFRRPGTGRVDPSTGHPLPVRRRVDGSTKDRVNQRRDDGVLWRIGKAAITAGFPSIRQDEFQLWE